MIRWLGLGAFTAGRLGSNSGPGTKIAQAVRPKKKRLEDLHVGNLVQLQDGEGLGRMYKATPGTQAPDS